MPEFIMEGRKQAARELDAFTYGFIEAMFFTNSSPAWTLADIESDPEGWKEAREEGTIDGELPGDLGYTDIHPESLAAIKADCEDFQTQCRVVLDAAYSRPGYDAAQAGRDLWFTSQGHGVGYWDRAPLDYTPEGAARSLGEYLTDKAREFGESHVWFADHVEHGDSPFVHYQSFRAFSAADQDSGV